MRLSFVLLLLIFPLLESAQNVGKKNIEKKNSGAVGLTNKGISNIPALSLGKPAGGLSLFIGDRLKFEPEFLFSLNGVPWAFNFWWHYKLVDNKKVSLKIGAPIGISFKKKYLDTGADSVMQLLAGRVVDAESVLEYSIVEKKIKVGNRSLFLFGFDNTVPHRSTYISFFLVCSNLLNTNQIVLRLRPQIFYLRVNHEEGEYIATDVLLERAGFPLSLSSTMNKKISSEIAGSSNFLWNLSLRYLFNF